MKIAILSDIHGNIYALRSVLADAKALGVEKILVLGDIVGYYYYPGEVLDLLSNWDYTFIRGNHEDILSAILHGKADEALIFKKYGSAHFKAAKELTEAQIAFLTQSPEQLVLQLDGVNILMCHGTPWDHNAYLYPDSPVTLLEKCNIKDMDFVFIGHSHYAFQHITSGSVLINAGSVGQSRKKGGLAQWVLLDTMSSKADFMTSAYNVKPLLADIDFIDPGHAYLSKILTRANEV